MMLPVIEVLAAAQQVDAIVEAGDIQALDGAASAGDRQAVGAGRAAGAVDLDLDDGVVALWPACSAATPGWL